MKMAIVHGGLMGVYELVDVGLPAVGMPIFFDQQHNVANLVSKGCAVKLDLHRITKDYFLENIKKIIYNKRYVRIASQLSTYSYRLRRNLMYLGTRVKHVPHRVVFIYEDISAKISLISHTLGITFKSYLLRFNEMLMKWRNSILCGAFTFSFCFITFAYLLRTDANYNTLILR